MQGEAAGLRSLPGDVGEQEASPVPGVRGRGRALQPEPGTAARCQHSLPGVLGSAIRSPEAMATCGKLAEGRAGLGNLKQH